MAIDKDRIKKQQRKRVYEKSKKKVKRSSDIDLSQAGVSAISDIKDNDKGILLDGKKHIIKCGKAVDNVVKSVENSESDSNDDTAKENISLYAETSEAVVSKVVSKVLSSDMKTAKQDNISHKSNMLSGNSTHCGRYDTQKLKKKQRYKKNRRRLYRNKTTAKKAVNKDKALAERKATIKASKHGIRAIAAVFTFILCNWLLIMPLFLIVSVASCGEAYNQAQQTAQFTYPAEDSDITKAIAYWQSLQVDIKTQLDKVPDLTEVRGRYDTKKSSACEFMTDNTALLSFISAYYVPYTDSWNFDDAQPLLDEVFDKMYGIEYSISNRKLDYSINEKKSWDDILNEYFDENQKMRYQNYTDHKGGAIKAFSSPFAFDWSGYITSPFGYRDWGNGDVEFHKGVDFGVSHGTEILNIADGTVVKTYTACTHDYPKDEGCGCGGNYGNYVDVLTEDGQYYITYGHMADVFVSIGDTVKNGQVVGTVGCTGWSTGNHLHLEMRLGTGNGELIDPTTYIQDYVPIEEIKKEGKQ